MGFRFGEWKRPPPTWSMSVRPSLAPQTWHTRHIMRERVCVREGKRWSVSESEREREREGGWGGGVGDLLRCDQ